MRDRERLKIEKRQEQEECFHEIKVGVGDIFSDPLLRSDLERALIFPRLSPRQQTALFEDMVQKNAKFCLGGDPEIRQSAEHQCHFLTKMDHLAHARPALERAVELYRKAGKPMPQCLKEWAENPGDPRPKKPGPRSFAQDWTAIRDHIIALAIDWAVGVRQDPEWPERLPIRRTYASNGGKKDYSICRAVIEVLKERYGSHPYYFLPSSRTVWNARDRYQNEMRTNRNQRTGRPLLPPQGLGPVLNPPGIDTDGLEQTIRKVTEDHVHRCAQRDFDDSQ